MNPEVKAKWLAALRSGEYEQTEGRLHDKVGYCCLGVLCDLYTKEVGGHWEQVDTGSHTFSFYDGVETPADGFPTLAVCEWAGLPNNNPSVTLEVPDDWEDRPVGGKIIASLSETNDELGCTFGMIANIVEEQL